MSLCGGPRYYLLLALLTGGCFGQYAQFQAEIGGLLGRMGCFGSRLWNCGKSTFLLLWTALIERNRKYDLFILDHTYGIGYQSTDHLSTKDFIKHVQIIRSGKLLKDDGTIYATHLSTRD